jgi:hypothetical protein
VNRVALVVALLLGSRAAGAAGPCPRGDDPAAGPLMGGNGPADNGPADFGAVPETCGATDATLRLRSSLLVASTMPDYYGRVTSSGTLRGRYKLAPGSTLSVAADLLNHRYVNTGGLASQSLSVGPATVAFHQAFLVGAGTAAAAYARVLLPIDTARESGIATGLELGGSLRMEAGARWVIDGGLSLAAPLDVTGGQAHLRVEPGALAEAWLRLRPWAALVGGASLRMAVAPDLDLITTVPRLGARFAVRGHFWTAALLELPVAGRDRTDLIAGLYAGYIP